MSTAPSSDARKLCHHHFDALYTTRAAYCSNTKVSRLMALCKYLNVDCTKNGKFIIQGSEHGVKYCPPPIIPIYPPYETIPKTDSGRGAPFSFIDDLTKARIKIRHNRFFQNYIKKIQLSFNDFLNRQDSNLLRVR